MEKQIVQLSMEEVNANLAQMFDTKIKELGLTKVDARYAIFPGVDEKEALKLRKVARLKDWIRGMYHRDQVAVAKALTGLTTSGLGFVPEEFRVEVIRVMEDFGLVRRVANVFPTDLLTINLHAANGVVTVSWVDAGAIIPQSDPTFTEPVLSVKKLAGITAMYKELFDDAKFPLVEYLSELYGEAMAGEEDVQGLVGTGSPFHGLVGGTITGQVTVPSAASSYTGFTPDDLLALAMAVPTKYRSGSAFFMHPTVFSYVQRYKATTGEYLIQSPVNASVPPNIWGYPIYLSDKLPSTDAVSTKFIGFANPKRLYFADRQEMEIDISDQATLTTTGNLWERHMTAVKATERVGMVWTLGAGTAVLRTAAA